MPNNKDNKNTETKGAMGNKPDREFVGQGQNPGSGKSGQGQQAGTKSGRSHEDDDMNTAGGREGQFSDKNRSGEGQWSPGSGQSSDQ